MFLNNLICSSINPILQHSHLNSNCLSAWFIRKHRISVDKGFVGYHLAFRLPEILCGGVNGSDGADVAFRLPESLYRGNSYGYIRSGIGFQALKSLRKGRWPFGLLCHSGFRRSGNRGADCRALPVSFTPSSFRRSGNRVTDC